MRLFWAFIKSTEADATLPPTERVLWSQCILIINVDIGLGYDSILSPLGGISNGDEMKTWTYPDNPVLYRSLNEL